jgi:O-antigen ligase
MTSAVAPFTQPFRLPDSLVATRVAAAGLVALIFISHMFYAPQIILNIPWEDADLVLGSGDTGRQVMFALIFGCLAFTVARYRGVPALLDIPWPLLVLFAWCWLSVSWAIDPDIATRRIAFTTLVAIGVVYAVQILRYRIVIQVLVGCYIAMLCMDLVAVALFPLAVHTDLVTSDSRLDVGLAGDWRGLHENKNVAGAICALAAIVLACETARLRSLIVGPICTLVALLFLFETQSKTSGGFIGVAMMIGVLAHYGMHYPRARNIGILCVAGGLCLWFGLGGDLAATQYWTALFDDPASLTGRVQVWPTLLAYAADNPLFGAGFGSFWDIGSASPVYRYGATWAFHGHNGYLDILVTTGGIGLALALFALVLRPLYLLFYRPLPDFASRFLLCSTIVFVCLHDLLETSLLNRAEPPWVILLIVYCLLESVSRVGKNLA